MLPESKTTGATQLDWRGAVLVGLAAGLLVYPLIQGREADWAPWTFAMMASSFGVLGLFAWYQRRREQTGRDPLITMSLFAKRAFSSGLGVIMLFFGAFTGLMLAITLYMQLGLGFTALHAGLSLGPICLGMAIGAVLGGGLLTQRFGRRVLHAGFAVLIVGVAATYAVIDAQAMTVTSWQLAGPLLLAGFGVGLVVAPLFGFILAAVNDEETGSASGVLNALQQLASAVGVAVLGTVFFAALPSPGYVDGLEQVLILVVGADRRRDAARAAPPPPPAGGGAGLTTPPPRCSTGSRRRRRRRRASISRHSGRRAGRVVARKYATATTPTRPRGLVPRPARHRAGRRTGSGPTRGCRSVRAPGRACAAGSARPRPRRGSG